MFFFSLSLLFFHITWNFGDFFGDFLEEGIFRACSYDYDLPNTKAGGAQIGGKQDSIDFFPTCSRAFFKFFFKIQLHVLLSTYLMAAEVVPQGREGEEGVSLGVQGNTHLVHGFYLFSSMIRKKEKEKTTEHYFPRGCFMEIVSQKLSFISFFLKGEINFFFFSQK